MWRWSILVLVLLHKHTISQPLNDDTPNDRAPRQLDFEECCPCFDKSDVDRDASSLEPVAAASGGGSDATRHLGDCICRDRAADSQGAASVFFPTAVRNAGAFLRPSDKKEDLKPLFNPEVDLASSVLQTLREVTDEEYRDALARDAAKSAVKAAEDMLIGDAVPQESANLVTIVVNPALTDDDDVIPQASHIKQSRCIHPLESSSKMRMAKKPNLFVYKPRLAKPKPPLLHHIFDSGVGASNVHEQIMPFDEDARTLDNDISPLRLLDSETMSSTPNIDTDDDCEDHDNFRSGTEKNKLFEFNSSLLHSLRNKIDNSLLRTPKKFKNFLAEKTSNSDIDLSTAPSDINEQAEKRIPYFKTSSVLERIKQKSRPLSLTNLLNLRDVEIIPPKDLIKKIETNEDNKSRFVIQPNIDEPRRSFYKNADETLDKDSSQALPKIIEERTGDAEESPSFNDIQFLSKDGKHTDNNCDKGISEAKSDTNADESNINADHDNINADQNKIKPITTEILDVLPKNKEELPMPSIENSDCVQTGNTGGDSITDASTNIITQQEINNENKSQSLENRERTLDKDCDEQEKDISTSKDNTENNNNKPKFKLLDTSLVDKTITNIKENIAKRIEDLKNIKIGLKNKDGLNREVNDDEDNKELSIVRNENNDPDCQDEPSVQVTTVSSDVSFANLEDATITLKPELFDSPENFRTLAADSSIVKTITLKPDTDNENIRDTSDCSDEGVSFKELQRLSDSMLQQEEQDRSNIECNKSDDMKVEPLQNSNSNADLLDADNSNNIIVEDKKAKTLESSGDTNDQENACKSNLESPQSSKFAQIDSNVDASEIITSSVPQSNDVLGSQPIMQPTNILNRLLPSVSEPLNIPLFDSLPRTEDIKAKLTNLFENNDVRYEEPLSESKFNLPSQDTLNSMTSAASTSSFQSRVPSSRLLEDLNIKRLELKPQSSNLPELPKIDLQSFKSKLPLPNHFEMKMFPLPSPLNNKQSLSSNTLRTGAKNSKINVNKNNFRLREFPESSNFKGQHNNVISRLSDTKDLLTDSPLEATNHIHSTLKNTQRAFESRLKQLGNNNMNLLNKPVKGSSLLDSLSRHHEDMSDKLKGLQMDLNDRFETMRNDLIDRSKLLTSRSRGSNLSNIGKQKKGKQPSKPTWQASTTKVTTKTPSLRKPSSQKPLRITSPSKSTKPSFRMSGAASVPVPSTMQVPELKTVPEHTRPLPLKHASPIVRNNIWQPDSEALKEISGSKVRPSSNLQEGNLFLRKQFGAKKESKIVVSFSTTPRPAMNAPTAPYLPKVKTGNTRDDFGAIMVNDDHFGSPSITAPSISKNQAPDSGNRNTEKYLKTSVERLPVLPKTARREENRLNTPIKEDLRTKSVLQSWPRATESSFLKKVREAFQTRLSKTSQTKNLQAVGPLNNLNKGQAQAGESNSDMARSATENKEIIESPLKENVSYKCKMVCTKDIE